MTTVGELASGFRGRPVRGWRLVCPRCGGPVVWVSRGPGGYACDPCKVDFRELAALARGPRDDAAGRWG